MKTGKGSTSWTAKARNWREAYIRNIARQKYGTELLICYGVYIGVPTILIGGFITDMFVAGVLFGVLLVAVFTKLSRSLAAYPWKDRYDYAYQEAEKELEKQHPHLAGIPE
jgi:hypothetical protein